jgi:hypothetical protein
MINTVKLDELLERYKNDYFPTHWEEEKFKWVAVKHFQDNWDIDDQDFSSMFLRATEKTESLLASAHNFPRGMIAEFAQADASAVKEMFTNLFDENRDVTERVLKFMSASDQLRQKYGAEKWGQHYQGLNSISTYLWLRYPDKYYLFKFSVFQLVAQELESDFVPKKGANSKNLIGGIELYDQICAHISKDDALKDTFKAALTSDCYQDEFLRTLTIDVGVFISRSINANIEWSPKDYSPNISTDQWTQLLTDPNIFDINSLKIMKRLKDIGGSATCKQLSENYGNSVNFYNITSSKLAQRVYNKTNCPIMVEDTENSKWWPILYVGKYADGDVPGVYIWKIREELSSALDNIDLKDVPLFDKPVIWKISHGTAFISKSEAEIFEKRGVIVVDRFTSAKGKSGISQGEHFTSTMKSGDYFYLCYGNSVQLFGKINSDSVSQNPEKKEEWFERSYTLIALSKDQSAYKDIKKWWTPNDNSTCVPVNSSENELFESLILKPYFDLKLKDVFEGTSDEKGFWWLNANPNIWRFRDIAVGEVVNYTLYNDNRNKRRIFQNFLDAKAGDFVIGYESSPVKKVVALCEISQENDGESIYFKKTKSIEKPIDIETLKKQSELEHMEFLRNLQGSLFRLTRIEYEKILEFVEDEVIVEEPTEIYTKDDFLSEVYMSGERYEALVSLLKSKRNLILQGAPGVGKTFIAKRLAYAMMGLKAENRIELIHFHQNYSYEDFMMGYRPSGEGFELKPGVFHNFCNLASNNPDLPYFFIIDEINRGNMSKIFGELLMLIENDYRGTKVTLAYNGKTFSVPQNLYIIGMMNTADRSLAIIDYALRRRFSFFEIDPGFDTKGFRDYQANLKNETLDSLVDCIKELNIDIEQDNSLGKGFCIGHSYLCGQKICTENWMHEVVEYDILPMLREYWFDDGSKVKYWEQRLRGVFNE